MTKNKQAKIMGRLGNNMTESTTRSPIAPDRFEGFTPNSNTGGEMSLDRIMEDDSQPRKHFDEEALKNFAEHLKIHGVKSAIQLRWSEQFEKWLIVFGHRRYRASILAGLKTIPCTFVDGEVDESKIRITQLVENCQREDLQPLEMANAMEALIGLTGWTNRQVAKELGMSHVTVGRYRDLVKLPSDLQTRVNNGELAPSVAIEVLRIKDKAKQKQVGQTIANQKLNRAEAKRAVEEAAQITKQPTLAKSAREKELLFQNRNISIYRNPNANDLTIQKELMAAAAQIDAEKIES